VTGALTSIAVAALAFLLWYLGARALAPRFLGRRHRVLVDGEPVRTVRVRPGRTLEIELDAEPRRWGSIEVRPPLRPDSSVRVTYPGGRIGK